MLSKLTTGKEFKSQRKEMDVDIQQPVITQVQKRKEDKIRSSSSFDPQPGLKRVNSDGTSVGFQTQII